MIDWLSTQLVCLWVTKQYSDIFVLLNRSPHHGALCSVLSGIMSLSKQVRYWSGFPVGQKQGCFFATQVFKMCADKPSWENTGVLLKCMPFCGTIDLQRKTFLLDRFSSLLVWLQERRIAIGSWKTGNEWNHKDGVNPFFSLKSQSARDNDIRRKPHWSESEARQHLGRERQILIVFPKQRFLCSIFQSCQLFFWKWCFTRHHGGCKNTSAAVRE